MAFKSIYQSSQQVRHWLHTEFERELLEAGFMAEESTLRVVKNGGQRRGEVMVLTLVK